VVETDPPAKDDPRPDDGEQEQEGVETAAPDEEEIEDPLKRETIKFLVRLPTGLWLLADEKQLKRLQKRFEPLQTRAKRRGSEEDWSVVVVGAEARRWREQSEA
jgi:hypothetical protein